MLDVTVILPWFHYQPHLWKLDADMKWVWHQARRGCKRHILTFPFPPLSPVPQHLRYWCAVVSAKFSPDIQILNEILLCLVWGEGGSLYFYHIQIHQEKHWVKTTHSPWTEPEVQYKSLSLNLSLSLCHWFHPFTEFRPILILYFLLCVGHWIATFEKVSYQILYTLLVSTIQACHNLSDLNYLNSTTRGKGKGKSVPVLN
jgi:hypothetical protein